MTRTLPVTDWSLSLSRAGLNQTGYDAVVSMRLQRSHWFLIFIFFFYVAARLYLLADIAVAVAVGASQVAASVS